MKAALISTLVAVVCGLTSSAAIAQDSPWQIRFRGIVVSPTETTESINIGGFAEVDEGYTPEIDITYFFDKNWSVELIAGTTQHGVRVRDSAVGNVNLGEVWVLPPTLTLQYHFGDETWPVRPYVGAGINYTTFYSVDEPDTGIVTDVDYSDSFSFALQGGIDVPINKKWHINFDVKYIDINTDVDVNNGLAAAEVALDPLVIGFGFGYRF